MKLDVLEYIERHETLLSFRAKICQPGGCQLLLQVLYLRQGLLELHFEPGMAFVCCHVASVSDKAHYEQYRSKPSLYR